MKHEIQQLSSEIRDALARMSEGTLRGSDAEYETNRLEAQFEKLRRKTQPVDGRNNFEGLCYSHNTENCSIFTGIFDISPQKSQCIARYGNSQLLDKITEILNNRFSALEEKETITVTPGDEPSLRNNLHIYPFRKSGRSFLSVVSLSSSVLFDIKVFIHFGNCLDMLFPVGKDHPSGVIDTFHAIRSYIEQNRNKYDLHAQIYLFPDLDTIFSHAGTYTLFDVSDTIEKRLAELWGAHIPLYTMSIKEYAVIVPEEIGLGKHDIVKGDFYYNGIPLPHLTRSLPLNAEESFYTFIDTLFSMSQG